MSCVFCDMQKADERSEFENDLFCARLDIHPVSPGHLLLIPKRHVERLSSLKRPEERALEDIRRDAEKYAEGRRDHLTLRYRKIRDAATTPNSPWFAQRALDHPKLGWTPDGFNFFVNEGEAGGQTVRHLHYHVVPRYRGDVEDPSGGGRYVIPEMGNYRIPRIKS